MRVTVAGDTTTSDSDFTVLAVPVITAVTPTIALAGSVVANFQVTGLNLTDSTFGFTPEFVPPALSVTSATIDPTGTSATLNVTLAAGAVGSFVVVATNTFGSSNAFSTAANTLLILDGAADIDQDGLSTSEELALGTSPLLADTDGDGFLDSEEIEFGSDPTDANSIPLITVNIGSAFASAIAISNILDPVQTPSVMAQVPITKASGMAVSILNEVDPTQTPNVSTEIEITEASGAAVSILNEADPGDFLSLGEALLGIISGGPITVENQTQNP